MKERSERSCVGTSCVRVTIASYLHSGSHRKVEHIVTIDGVITQGRGLLSESRLISH